MTGLQRPYPGMVFNIGFGEILFIAVIGLLVFGPDRLPDAVRRGAGLLRQARELALQARQQVSDAAGLQDEDTAGLVADLRELHPRRIASSVLDPLPPEQEAPGAPKRSTGIDPDLT